MKQIVGKVVDEVGETIKQPLEAMVTTISPRELLGDIRPMSQEEVAQKKAEDEAKNKKEMEDVRSQMVGRNVEGEMEKIRDEKKRKEEEEEKAFLENIRRQREAEEAERQQLEAAEPVSPAKQKKKRGSAFVKGKGKASTAEMSQTAEYFKKPD